MQMSDLTKKLLLADRTYGLYRENEKTLVGFSGGADSMALLHALTLYLGCENIVAVHINHMLRGDDADRDERFCEEYCKKNSITFFAKKVNVTALCGGKGFEEAARKCRYEIFEKLALKTGCTTVSLAHTADDNLETVIFHLCRGAGAAGISGIPPKRPLGKLFIVRPLIDCTRSEILAYTATNALTYRTDATNDDTRYTRNFIRKNIVPLLKEINPTAAENARKTSHATAALEAHLEAEAEALLPHAKTTEIPLSVLKEKSDALLYAVFNQLYKNAGGVALPEAQAKKLLSFLREEKRGVSLSLPRGITAELRGEHLRFFASTETVDILTEKKSLHLGENRVNENITVLVGVPCEKQNAAYYRCAQIPTVSLNSLCICPREGGERYRFGGMTRTLKKLLCGAETKKKIRPVFYDENGLLWHPDFPVRDSAKNVEMTTIHYIEKQ